MTLEEENLRLREDRARLAEALSLTANYAYSVDPHLESIFQDQLRVLSEIIHRSLMERTNV